MYLFIVFNLFVESIPLQKFTLTALLIIEEISAEEMEAQLIIY